ncbi:TPA: hypothetical protein HA249_04005 [Candidatus Woesearchaeota archaeon]|nr:MAG: hypothetical protein QT07_C0010G0007 [archaeon GW2011_AR16]HIG96023.1 hypothetical protein [Candidatus Woesearchaeota archaeon]HIH47526.1 hypothetical protein [Candidatus Woesearchaeota archaeon]HII88973.1 hypothetical protein [Candidatus Woesearchaeota archaeon]
MDNKPMFIKVEEYKEVKQMIDLLKGKLKEAKQVLGDIEELKKQEEQQTIQWTSELDEVEQRVELMDTILLDSNR